MTTRILVLDDEQALCDLLSDMLDAPGREVSCFTSMQLALEAIATVDFDLVLTDLQLGADNGLELCREIVARRPDLPVVVMTAFGSMKTAIAAIRAGAYDFINKPLDANALHLVVERAIRHRALRRQVRRLTAATHTTGPFPGIIGESKPMRKVYDLLTRLEESDAPALVTGESGTGKELVAKALHDNSRYREGPFVAINCAAVPPTLLESTLFGHVKGAFTDAKGDKQGLFLEADGGTLFLDEVGEMPADMQSKLLRVLQERKVRPVGGTEEIPFDARLVSATNRDLEDEVESTNFREDLFYRIAVVVVSVPPLRRRGNDILLLAQSFLTQAASRTSKTVEGLASETARKLLDYEWPGNVRQLQNVMERAVALTQFEQITVDDLPEKISKYTSKQLVVHDDDADNMLTLEELEQRYIQRVMEVTGGNKTQAAKVLGIDRRTLYRKIARDDG